MLLLAFLPAMPQAEGFGVLCLLPRALPAGASRAGMPGLCGLSSWCQVGGNRKLTCSSLNEEIIIAKAAKV